MVSIIDYSKESSEEEGIAVGKIEDTGSFKTEDGILESLLEEFVENGVKTYIPEYTNTGVDYYVGIVESGQRGFAKAVVQHLPSPYYGKREEIQELPDYDVKDIQTDKNNNPLRGKQGMDTVSRFTSLASESDDPTRERVDADWNEVEDEENLPESAKQKQNRQYVDNPNEAPDYADVQEGEQEDTYYYIPDESQENGSSSGYGSGDIGYLDFSYATTKDEMQDNQDWAFDQLRKNHGGQVDTLSEQMQTWKTDGYTARSFLALWNSVANITGNQAIPDDLERYQDSDSIFSGSEEYDSMIRDMIDMNQESIRESYGEEITVYRGFAGDVTNEVFKRTDEGYEVDPLALESWTMDKEVGERFQSFAGGGVLVKKTMSPEDFAVATQIMEPSTGDYFEELTAMRDGPYTISSEEIIDGEENISKQDNHRKLTGEESDWINALRESEKSKSNDVIIKQINLDKDRQYVDSPEDAPDYADVQEGLTPGTYYYYPESSDEDDDDDGDILDDIMGELGDIGPDSGDSEERETLSEEEQREVYRDTVDNLPIDPPKEINDQKEGIEVNPDDFYDGTNSSGQEQVADLLDNPEFLDVPTRLSEISDEDDYGPFDDRTDIPVYDEGKYSTIDVQMNTEDFSMIQQRINEEHGIGDQDWLSHFGSAEPEKVEEYSETLQDNPGEIPMPHLVVNEEGEVTSRQEGRHRSLAAMDADINEIPVRIAIEPGRKGKQERQYIDNPSEAPEGVDVEEGEQEDVYYYIPEDSDDNSQSYDQKTEEEFREDVEQRVEGKEGRSLAMEMIDIIKDNIMVADSDVIMDTVSDHLDWDRLSYETAAKSALEEHTEISEGSSLNQPSSPEEMFSAEKELRKNIGGSNFRDVDNAGQAWVSGNDMHSENAAPIWQVAVEETGNKNIYSQSDDSDILETDVSEDKKESIKQAVEFERERLRDKFGDQIPVFRGMRPNLAYWEDEENDRGEIEEAIDQIQDGKDLELEHSCAESWTTNPVEALRFADDGIIIHDVMSPDEVMISANSFTAFKPDQAEFIRTHEGTEEYVNGENVFSSDDLDPILMAQWGIEQFNNMNPDQKSKQDNNSVKINGENNQAEWMAVLREEYDYDDGQKEKNRVYVDDRSEVPEWATPQEGDRDPDAIYYETDNAPDNEDFTPDGLKYSELEDITSMTDKKAMEEENIEPGGMSDNMYIGYNKDGEKVYIQNTDNAWDVDEISQREAKIAMDHMEIRAPNMSYNSDEKVIVMEDIGENSNRPSKKLGDSGNESKDKFLEAACGKLLIGDTDLSGNIMLDDNGEFYPIDYDLAGKELSDKVQTAKDNQESLPFDVQGFWEKTVEGIQNNFEDYLDDEVTQKDIQNKLEELAERIDIDEYKGSMIRVNGSDRRIDRSIIQNIEDIRQGELWE